MKLRDLKNLLARAAAALETPDDLTPEDKTFLIEDLLTAEDEHDVDLDEPEILTHAQIARWVRLQHKRPGYEIERDPFSIGYWGRQLDWARPEEPGDELDGWLKADSELKEGCIEGNAPQWLST